MCVNLRFGKGYRHLEKLETIDGILTMSIGDGDDDENDKVDDEDAGEDEDEDDDDDEDDDHGSKPARPLNKHGSKPPRQHVMQTWLEANAIL